MKRVCPAIAIAAVLAVSGLTSMVGAAPARSGNDTASAQSPIDLRHSEVTFVRRLSAIRFSYPGRAAVTVTNTGSPDEEATVRTTVPPGAFITLGGTRYDLQQFHWHTPSEHEINGRRSPMEMHMVHAAADGSLLVIGALIKKGRTNRTLKPIFDDLPENAGDTRDVAGVRINKLLPHHRSSYRYKGSLTTPPFTEGVRWIVLTHPITLSKRQIDAFRALFEEGNSREVQPLNGRKVRSDARRHHADRD